MTGLIADTSDHRLIRQSTAAIADRYGHGYYAERAREGGHIAELWASWARRGCSGCTCPPSTGVAAPGWPS
jgi:hypothetical protein